MEQESLELGTIANLGQRIQARIAEEGTRSSAPGSYPLDRSERRALQIVLEECVRQGTLQRIPDMDLREAERLRQQSELLAAHAETNPR